MEQVQLQLSEFELLQCMYPASNELFVHDVTVLADMHQFAIGDTDICLRNLSFTVKLSPEGQNGHNNLTLDVDCFYPLDYPNDSPVVSVKCGNLTRDKHQEINKDLKEYITTLEKGELCMVNVLQWLQDCILKSTAKAPDANNEDRKSAEGQESEDPAKSVFSRYLIQSHHIYGKDKRRNILDWATELSLTGFCLPGKPGCICVEGQKQACEKFWSSVRRLNWKKISLRHHEDFFVARTEELGSLRCFAKFEELNLDPHTCHGGRENIMDKGKMYEFLVAHNCQHIFSFFFSVEGQGSLRETSQ
ncbi:RWD domain-containing protein 2B [Callorhinchus milii]|uniref:RWD domain-containing protein 2B-like n=1 Tax=Callorhinchus milii TaxID=7868 RepID=A0A4W3GF99_CALMI|nr:RWD domain-containing protein 2B [Callorhinchus milii]XP_007882871.1 RWD domain-containing protein 2B [Callorhinchus milii]|eukprot:gi/632988007/ref/XP_007882870.1/ PREDICTED: RWD domain-containing protein 2B-like [Callorhinchus milii]